MSAVIQILREVQARLHVAADDVSCGVAPYETELRVAESNIKTAIARLLEMEAAK